MMKVTQCQLMRFLTGQSIENFSVLPEALSLVPDDPKRNDWVKKKIPNGRQIFLENITLKYQIFCGITRLYS